MKLLQGTSHPWTFKGSPNSEGIVEPVYDLDINTSSKIEKAIEIIEDVYKKPGINKVMVGSPWRPTVEQMAKTFEEK